MKAQVDLVRVLTKLAPKARVEAIELAKIQEAEKDLETPEVTAFVSSRAFINEIDIYGKLQLFGSLRALSFSYSKKYQKWYCKASFYEKFSLDQLLMSNSASLRSLSDGSAIKIEQLKKPCYFEIQGRLLSQQQRVPVREAPETRLPTAIRKQQISSIINTSCGSAKSEAVLSPKPPRTSMSCSRDYGLRLPAPGMFSNNSFYIENVLRILKSRNQEKSSKTLSFLRSKSTDSSPRKESGIQVTVPARRDRIQRKPVVQNLILSEKELLFLEIGQTKATMSHVLNRESSCVNPNHIPILGHSYLSQSDLSDGYTAFEMVTGGRLAAQSVGMTHRSQDSAKNSSLVLLTKYSSDADNSSSKYYCRYSDGPSDSNFDTLFDSHTGQDNTIVRAPRPVWTGVPVPTCIDYFAFPCS